MTGKHTTVQLNLIVSKLKGSMIFTSENALKLEILYNTLHWTFYVIISLSTRLHTFLAWSVLSCIMGALRNPSAPIPHDSLHSSPF
jgi:hypothetical protein